MKSKLSLIIVMLIFSLPQAEAYINYNDGGTHDIDSTISETVYVDHQSPGAMTTVNIVENGEVTGIMEATHDSRINMTAGSVEDLRISYNSQINISGGQLGTGLRCYNKSQATITGGVFGEFLFGSDDSRITISGGNTVKLGAYDNAQINIYDINSTGYTEVWEGGYIDIFGGTFNLLRASHSGAITIHGSNFNYDLGEIPHTAKTQGYLTGTLSNGDPIDCVFSISGDASIILVPEPCTIALLGLGGLLLRKTRDEKLEY